MKQIYIEIGTDLIDEPKLIYNEHTKTWYVHAIVGDEYDENLTVATLNPKEKMLKDGRPIHEFLGIDPFVRKASPLRLQARNSVEGGMK